MLLTAFNNTNYWQKFILSSFKAKKGNSATIVRVRFFHWFVLGGWRAGYICYFY